MPGLAQADFAAADVLGDVLGSERGALYGLVPAGKALHGAVLLPCQAGCRLRPGDGGVSCRG